MVRTSRPATSFCLILLATFLIISRFSSGAGLSSYANSKGQRGIETSTLLARCAAPALTLRAGVTTEPSAPDSYSPVAPVQALLHATRLNLKIVAEWLGDGDFDSAAESAERVKLLLSLCALQSSTESWQRRVGLLRSRCDQLISLASNKDAEACIELSKDLLATLGSLEQELPKADGIAVDDFRPPSSIRNLMKLLDGSYADAKVAKSLDELTALAYTIAEGTNVAQFLRNDPGWRDRAGEVREAAVKVAILKPDTDLKVARQELKNVYERCQACHKAFKR